MTLPTVDEVFSGKTMKASDLAQPRLLTIRHIDVRDFKNKEGTVTRKYVLAFDEDEREFVCNKTNTKMIAKYYGGVPEVWVGRKIVLFKADVDFGGDIVEGIRVRMPKTPIQVMSRGQMTSPLAGQHLGQSENPAAMDDEVPF